MTKHNPVGTKERPGARYNDRSNRAVNAKNAAKADSQSYISRADPASGMPPVTEPKSRFKL
jgi:hypothetical protein